MFDLEKNATFASSHDHNLTGPLNHDQVISLANLWFPEIRFHEKERFHPIDLQTLFTVPKTVFDSLPEAAKDEFRIEVDTASGTVRFDPPIVLDVERKVLGSGETAAQGLDDGSIDSEARYSHGGNLTASRKFFGASTTVAGGDIPAPGDPRVPRHPIVVRAEMRCLLEVLKHELQLDESPGIEVVDAVWGRFPVEETLFLNNALLLLPFTRDQKRDILRRLIEAHESHNQAAFQAALDDIPLGWNLVQRAWNAIKNYAFLEFSFVYAFNDYKEYGTWPWANEHEGDVEGCCVVFERRFLEQLASSPPTIAAEDIVPHTVITSVHEPYTEGDCLKRLPVVRERARNDLVVYVAPGSHATYLTPGSHDVLDFEDVVIDLPAKLPTWVLISALALAPVPFAIVVLLAGIVEHFQDSEDETSDNGASVGPGSAAPQSLKFDKRINVTPLSRFNGGLNIYQNQFRDALTLRAFPGKWGGSDGLVDHSSGWETKTVRYFHDFLKYGDIQSELIL